MPVENACRLLREADVVHVVAHIDADGICAGAIASMSLEREGIQHQVHFVKHMEEAVLDSLPPGLPWFVDLGAGSLEILVGRQFVISDHHVPSIEWPPVDRGSRGDLMAYSEPKDMIMVNPHLSGLDGSTTLSGAGTTYLIAKELSKDNIDLAHIAIIGAVGDLQDSRERGLVGLNRKVLADAVDAGRIVPETDIRLFGRETRPLQKLLAYTDDPEIPGLRNDIDASLEFIRRSGITPRKEGQWKPWSSLDSDEKEKLLSAIVKHMMINGSSTDEVRRLVGEVYTLKGRRRGTPEHDAKEYATLLNSCGRYDRALTGMLVLKGDRDAYKEALDLLDGHRKVLVKAMRALEGEVVKAGNFQYFNAGDIVSETVVGIVAGMLLTSPGSDPDLPILGFARAESTGEPMLKVSARMERRLEGRVDLAKLLKEACEEVGGFGGGHPIAAGGAIPEARFEEFLGISERIISEMPEA